MKTYSLPKEPYMSSRTMTYGTLLSVAGLIASVIGGVMIRKATFEYLTELLLATPQKDD